MVGSAFYSFNNHIFKPFLKTQDEKNCIYHSLGHNTGAFFSFLRKIHSLGNRKSEKSSWLYICWQRTREKCMFQMNWINVWIWIARVKIAPATSLSSQTSHVVAIEYPKTAAGKTNISGNLLELSFSLHCPRITVDKSAAKHLRGETVVPLW